MIKSIRRVFTKAKGEAMAILTIMDKSGEIEVVFFPKAYATEKDYLIENGFVTIDGRYDTGLDGNPQIIGDKALPLPGKTRTLWIQFLNEGEFQSKASGLVTNISAHYGVDSVKVFIQETRGIKEMKKGFEITPENLRFLEGIYGETNVKVVEK